MLVRRCGRGRRGAGCDSARLAGTHGAGQGNGCRRHDMVVPGRGLSLFGSLLFHICSSPYERRTSRYIILTPTAGLSSQVPDVAATFTCLVRAVSQGEYLRSEQCRGRHGHKTKLLQMAWRAAQVQTWVNEPRLGLSACTGCGIQASSTPWLVPSCMYRPSPIT